jgi:hypothetical protein
MSSFRNPVGSEDPAVYWRRRAKVGGALLAVILLIVLVVSLIVHGRGSASGAEPLASASASRSADAGATGASDAKKAREAAAAAAAAARAHASSAASTAASPTSSATSAPVAAGTSRGAKAGGTCRTSQIDLKAVTDKSQYGPTEQPKIAMSITNTGSAACHMDLGSSKQVLTITSGSETYWSSKDCQTGGTDQDVTLKAGQTLTTPSITWDRTRSSTSTCDTSRPAVTAHGASYHLTVAVGSMAGTTTAQFVLR